MTPLYPPGFKETGWWGNPSAPCFAEANIVIPAPPEFPQVQAISAYRGVIAGGSLDGIGTIVTAWIPSPEELEELNRGNPVYIGFLGEALPCHFVGSNFNNVTHPA